LCFVASGFASGDNRAPDESRSYSLTRSTWRPMKGTGGATRPREKGATPTALGGSGECCGEGEGEGEERGGCPFNGRALAPTPTNTH
jgi:hypothetical protein